MCKWRTGVNKITDTRRIVAKYEYHDEEDNETVTSIDIFSFDGIYNIWHSKSGSVSLKYKDIIAWIPIPD